MDVRYVALMALMLMASPAAAERMQFDHRLSPPLKAVLDANDPAMIDYNDRNPRYVTDVIAVRGKSAKDWVEALLIVARTPDKTVRSAGEWMAELRAQAERKCTSTLRTLTEDANSVTFERTSTGCPRDYPRVALYRVIAGQRSLFLLGVLVKDDLTEQSRGEWLALLGSARVE